MGSRTIRALAAAALGGLVLAACPVWADDGALAGHYYLTGVRETGSELVLGADGRFAWFLSYGALDQTAEGTWRREGAAVILAADAPDRRGPLFAALDREEWSAEAEQAVLDQQGEAAARAALARCLFLADGDAVATVDAATPVLAPPGAVALPSADQLGAARAARDAAEAMRRAAEEAAAAAVDAAAGSVQVDRARAALAAWREARWAAQDAARTAGAALPDLPEAVLPAACSAAPPVRAETLPVAAWTGGIAVRVVEPTYRQGARGVIVTLGLADGRTEQLETARRGLAIRPGRPPAAVTAVTLDFPPAPGRSQRFAVAPLTRGVLHFAIDGRQLVEPPFTTLRLRIDGAALLPDGLGLGRGRYERGR